MIYLIAFLIGGWWMIRHYDLTDFIVYVIEHRINGKVVLAALILLVTKLWIPLLILMLWCLVTIVTGYDKQKATPVE